MHTITTFIKSTEPISEYLKRNTIGSRAVRNTANFLIRNIRSALSKSLEERTQNENEAVNLVFTGIQKMNEQKKANRQKKISDLSQKYQGAELQAEIRALKPLVFLPYPTKERWMLSYEHIDAILKTTENEAYYSCTSQVNQKAIRKTCESWKGFFEELRRYQKHPEMFNGRPKAPKYLRELETTAHFPNQVCKFKTENGRSYLLFANTKEWIPVGMIPVRGVYVKTEIKPSYGGYKVLITFDDKSELPKVPEKPSRVLGIDLGVSNFAICAANTGCKPLLISGKWIKSENQWYNKERARLYSALTKGHDLLKEKKIHFSSKRLQRLSSVRENRFNNFFYHVAHQICKYSKEHKIEVIVVGLNQGWKQEVALGKRNNQNFVQIPFRNFLNKLVSVAAKYGIPVVEREESYTSRADITAMDPIPTFGTKQAEKAVFSGKRVKRGLYQCSNGQVMNADVNGAINIARKEYPEAFLGFCASSLFSVDVVTEKNFRPKTGPKPQPKKKIVSIQRKRKHNQKTVSARLRHQYRRDQRQLYKELLAM